MAPTLPELKLVVEEKRSAIDIFTLWLPRLGAVLAFLFIGLTKFNNDPHGEWVRIFDRIGWGQWFRYFTGAMQVSGALLLLTRRTLTLGAFMLACTMVGAMIVDVFVLRSPGFVPFPGTLLGLVVVVWYAGRFGAKSAPHT